MGGGYVHGPAQISVTKVYGVHLYRRYDGVGVKLLEKSIT